MTTKLLFFLTSLFFLTAFFQNILLAQTKGGSSEITITGHLTAKSWTKSSQSYCAQGSGYFVITPLGQEEEIVIETQAKIDFAKYTNLKNPVKITGYYQKKVIQNNDPYSQQPQMIAPDGSQSDFSCTVFVVTKIEKTYY
jgi:hypothetical protein